MKKIVYSFQSYKSKDNICLRTGHEGL